MAELVSAKLGQKRQTMNLDEMLSFAGVKPEARAKAKQELARLPRVDVRLDICALNSQL